MRAQQFGQGENVLAVRNRGQDFVLNPLAVGQHAFLMTTWAEITRLAGKHEQVLIVAFNVFLIFYSIPAFLLYNYQNSLILPLELVSNNLP